MLIRYSSVFQVSYMNKSVTGKYNLDTNIADMSIEIKREASIPGSLMLLRQKTDSS